MGAAEPQLRRVLLGTASRPVEVIQAVPALGIPADRGGVDHGSAGSGGSGGAFILCFAFYPHPLAPHGTA